MEITKSQTLCLLKKLKKWLGDEGEKYFMGLYFKYGKINTAIPHAVHFREGMQIRNFLRGCEECKEWTAHDFDENWIPLIEAVVLGWYRDPEVLTHENSIIRAVAAAHQPIEKPKKTLEEN